MAPLPGEERDHGQTEAAPGAPSMSPDVAIVGAGPVRGVTALAFADAGAETRPVRVRRAGHPPERLGVDLSAVQHCRVGGFIVHPEDGSAPIRLPYPRGGYGLSCHHQSLVQGLRATLSHQPGVALVPRDARYRRQPAHLRFRTRLGGRVHPGRMAGRCRGQRLADTPVARYPIAADLPLAHGRILLEGAELPSGDYGHILMGGPGPQGSDTPGRVRIPGTPPSPRKPSPRTRSLLTPRPPPPTPICVRCN